jgi:hypothetical protein
VEERISRAKDATGRATAGAETERRFSVEKSSGTSERGASRQGVVRREATLVTG